MNTNLTEIILNQAPEVYEQMTRWGVVNCWIQISIFIAIVLMIFVGAWILNRKFKDEYEWPTAGVWVLSALLSSAFLFGAVAMMVEIAKIKTAPKAWLVDRIISKTK